MTMSPRHNPNWWQNYSGFWRLDYEINWNLKTPQWHSPAPFVLRPLSKIVNSWSSSKSCQLFRWIKNSLLLR